MSEEKTRHPIRFLFKLLIIVGLLSALGKFLATKKDEFAGMTEAEARARMEAKLAARFGEEKASEIVDKVIPVLADGGLFKTESTVETTI